MINVDVNVKNVMHVKKDHVWNPATCNCENGKYLASIMDDSAITCDEVIESYDEEAKTIPTFKLNIFIFCLLFINYYFTINYY